MQTTINCRRCGQPHPPEEYNSPRNPTCQNCLAERRIARGSTNTEISTPRPRLDKKDMCRLGHNYTDRRVLLRLLGFATYQDYLNSDLWKEIRERVFALKGRECFLCSKLATQAHHNRYNLNTLRGKRLKHIFPVCGQCHHSIEFKGGEKVFEIAKVQTAFRKKRRRRLYAKH